MEPLMIATQLLIGQAMLPVQMLSLLLEALMEEQYSLLMKCGWLIAMQMG